jgi:predicted dehydrogenase
MVDLGIIGAGIMGERLARAALEHATESVRVVGIWDPSAEAMARIGAELPAIPQLASAEAVIAAAECVYVASPPASHLEHGANALAAGKALFCEKPLAVDMTAGAAFMAQAAGARAAVNFPFASSFAVARLREWMPAIGAPQKLDIELAFATWPRGWQSDAAGWLDRPAQGGFTREVGSHFLFLSRRLLGPLVLHESAAEFPEAGHSERAIRATFSAGSLQARLTGGVGITEKDDHNLWTLTGDKGAIRLRDWSVAERLVDGAWQPDPDALPNPRMRPLVLKRQLAGVAAMTGGGTHDLATLAEAFEVQGIVEAILAR